MAEPSTPEIKISKNPIIQPLVDTERQKLEGKFPSADPKLLNQYARDKVAAGLRGERQKEQKAKVAMYDHLTGMLNRRWFDAELKKRVTELRRSKNTTKPLWLLYFDLDKFKDVNTQYGETPGGDRILKLISQLPFRAEEPIARLGGEEFGEIIDEEITEDSLARVLGRYMTAMKENSTKELASRQTVTGVAAENKVKEVTISFGLTQYVPGDSPESFLVRANAAMRRAKATGRNKIVIAEPINPSNREVETGPYIFKDLQPMLTT